MKTEHDEFYSSIAKYYREIFPYNAAQLQFIEKMAGGLADKKILDIGCATGALDYQLAIANTDVTGIDINEELLNQAKSLKSLPNLRFQKGNMLDLKSDFQSQIFDAAVCFGNTLVHLPTPELIHQMLNGVFSVLKSGGVFLLQILNYDYILSIPVTELPLIETENIRFVRKYFFEVKSPLIRFQTELHMKKEKKKIVNETQLYALKSNQLKVLLEMTGFNNIELFSSFKEDNIGGRHLPLIVKAAKPL